MSEIQQDPTIKSLLRAGRESEAAAVNAFFDIRDDLVTLMEIGWNDYLDESEPGWRQETPKDRFLPVPKRARELVAERILASYNMKEVE